MRGLKTLMATLLGTALLVAAVPASAKKPPAFVHYVACGVSQKAKPAHKCSKRRKKGAFFKSNVGDVSYTVCVKFPNKTNICTDTPQQAVQGTLYVNKIKSNIPGKHKVTWFVEGKRVGLFYFKVPG